LTVTARYGVQLSGGATYRVPLSEVVAVPLVAVPETITGIEADPCVTALVRVSVMIFSGPGGGRNDTDRPPNTGLPA